MKSKQIIPLEHISDKILIFREQKVLMDRDIALLYGIETKRLKEAVRRNVDRFPIDFMFEMSNEEFKNWRSKFASSNSDKMGLRYKPMLFTEQGIAMLSSVLNSKKAIEVNILIIRAFIKMRELLYADKKLALKVEQLEKQIKAQGLSLNQVIKVINRILKQPVKSNNKIGFKLESDKK